MGSSDTPETVSDPVRMNTQRISIFPLTGAIIFPSMQLPLHIFEPRYRRMLADQPNLDATALGATLRRR